MKEESAMRKWIVMLCVVLFAVGVVVCGFDDDSGLLGVSLLSGGLKKSYKMMLIVGVKGDEFYLMMNCGV